MGGFLLAGNMVRHVPGAAVAAAATVVQAVFCRPMHSPACRRSLMAWIGGRDVFCFHGMAWWPKYLLPPSSAKAFDKDDCDFITDKLLVCDATSRASAAECISELWRLRSNIAADFVLAIDLLFGGTCVWLE